MLFQQKRYGLTGSETLSNKKRTLDEVEVVDEEIVPKIAKTDEIFEDVPDDMKFDEKQGNVWVMAPKTLPIEQFPLSSPLIDGLKLMKISEMYPVQRAVVPATLSLHKSFISGDICVGSPTGSGKTLAYCLPILEILSSTKLSRLRVIILVPTTNLAIQVEKVFKSFKNHTRTIALALTTDSLEKEQQMIISDGSWLIDILICTPQKLSLHSKSTPGFTTKFLELLVIDEADRLISNPIDFAVIKDLCRIKETKKMEMTPVPKQFVGFRKLLFSATLKHNPSKIHELNLNRPQYFTYNALESKIKYTLPDSLSLFLILFDPNLKPLYLLELFDMHKKIVIFCATNEIAHRLHVLLNEMNVVTVEISSAHKQKRNQDMIESFSKLEKGIMITTDMMGRGMDLPDVDCIINYDLPNKLKTWIHRIGRSARGMKEGTSYTLLKQEELFDFRTKLTKVKSKSDAEEYLVSESKLEELKDIYNEALKKMKSKMKNISSSHYDEKM